MDINLERKIEFEANKWRSFFREAKKIEKRDRKVQKQNHENAKVTIC